MIIHYLYQMRKDINGYNGLYSVDEFGNVYSNQRIVERIGIGKGGHPCKPMTISEKKLKNYVANNGYHVVNLYKGGKATQRYVHDLVALMFIGEKPNRETVNHKNGIKTDNRIENLEYCSYKYNNLHAKETRLNKSNLSDYAKRCPVSAFKDGMHVGDYESCSDAERKLKCRHVFCIASGKRKSSNGYTFKFQDISK